MIKKLQIYLIFLLAFLPFYLFAQIPSETGEELGEVKYNPREEYLLGVGPIIGGSIGGIGFALDCNLSKKFSIQAGVGTGYYFESLFLTSRYYFFQTKLAPFFALGYATWRANSGIDKLNNINNIKKLNLSNGDFAHLLPLSIGLQYISESGLAAFITFDYILSPATTSSLPYGSAGFVWYF
jgi:hypothetical protein